MSDFEITGDQGSLFEVRDQRQPGWFFIDNEVVDKYGIHLGAYGIATYAVLSRRCNPSTQLVTNLSQRDIAAIVGVSQDRIRKSLNDLVQFGLIHVDVPARPSPGIISTISLLKVKTTERVAFSSSRELNVWRSRNKEVKTKTINKTLPPTPLAGGDLGLAWQNVCGYLKDDLSSAYVHNSLFTESAYDKYFRDAWLVGINSDIAVLCSPDPNTLREGVEKFQKRLRDTFGAVNCEVSAVRVVSSNQQLNQALEASA